MRLLVTGASGFLGRRIVPRLNSDATHGDPTVLAWSRATHGDLLDAEARRRILDGQQPDVVLHLAWLATGTPDYRDSPDNARWAEATTRFALEAQDRGIVFVGMGSMIEDDQSERSAYAISKRAAAAAIGAQPESSSRVAWLRPSWIFDFTELRPRVLRAYVSAFASGRAFQPATPETLLDFVHLDDVASAIQIALDRRVRGQWNINAGHQVSVRDLIHSYTEWRDGLVPDPPPAGEGLYDLGTPNMTEFGWSPRETHRLLGRYWHSGHVDLGNRESTRREDT